MTKAFFDIGPGVPESEAWDSEWREHVIIGLEPDPKRYAQLKDSFPGTLLNMAASDKKGILKGVEHPTSGFIAGGYPGLTHFYEVEACTLDFLDEKYGPFDEIAIWADIEGSELRMLRGAQNVLKKTVWVNLEIHTAPKTLEWAKSHEIFEFMKNLGFKPSRPEKGPTPSDTNYDVVFLREKDV